MRALLLLATVLLSGCVLHSKTPIFGEAEAVPALGHHRLTFAVSTFDKGVWVANDDPVVSAKAEGRHYFVPDAATPADLTKAERYYFIPLDGTRYVVEAVAGGEADYAIATWDGKTLLVSPLDCAALKTSLKTNDLVTFVDDACRLRPSDAPPLVLFEKLAQRAGEPSLRFVRQ
jgi:hypothetical protein